MPAGNQDAALFPPVYSASRPSHVSQERGQRVDGEVAGMVGGWRQASDFADQFFPAQIAGFGYSSSLHQLGDGRTAGHGWNATLGAEANVGDALDVQVRRFQWLFQFDAQLQNVSADGVFQARGLVGSFHLARIARVLKMIE
jgi:hypothetical protein